MQSKTGGGGAFEPFDTTTAFLSQPHSVADHGALLDPSTADVRRGCLRLLAAGGLRPQPIPPRWRAELHILRKDQKPDGSWSDVGYWNYIYAGRGSVLCGSTRSRRTDPKALHQQGDLRLKACQREGRRLGEGRRDYWKTRRRRRAKERTPSQTAWAVLRR